MTTSALPGTRRLDIRYVGPINGCYHLSSRSRSAEGRVQVFACRSQSIATNSAVLSAPVPGKPGETLTVKFDDFNLISGRISRVFSGGFAMDFAITDTQKEEIAAKIEWIKKRSTRAVRDKREQKRVIPPNPRSAITLADNTVQECFVIDVSRSGVAVSADVLPDIGAPVIVGRTAGKVVRHLAVGFAVHFDNLLAPGAFEKVLSAAVDHRESGAGATGDG